MFVNSRVCFPYGTSSQRSARHDSHIVKLCLSVTSYQPMQSTVSFTQSLLQPRLESGAIPAAADRLQSGAAVASRHALAQSGLHRCPQMPSSSPPAQPQHCCATKQNDQEAANGSTASIMHLNRLTGLGHEACTTAAALSEMLLVIATCLPSASSRHDYRRAQTYLKYKVCTGT